MLTLTFETSSLAKNEKYSHDIDIPESQEARLSSREISAELNHWMVCYIQNSGHSKNIATVLLLTVYK
jgi:hypothetical protein